jgi:putative transposase
MDFIRGQVQQGRAVESVCRVLSEQGWRVAARTYRAWQARRTLSARMLALAYLMNAIHSLAYAWEPAAVGGFRLRPEGCTGGGR